MPKKNRSRPVDFEGKPIPESKLPKGSIFIVDKWYSTARKLPAHLKKTCGHLFRALKGFTSGACKIEADGTLIPINVPALDTRSVGDLLSDLKRIEKKERQMRGFAKFYWDHVEERNLGNDKNKEQLYFQECAKLFWLPCASYSEYVAAKQLLAEEKATLGVALMKKTYYVEEEGRGGNDHRIVFHLQPKPILPPALLPRHKKNGLWCSQEEYIELCVKKGQVVSVEELQNDREENKGRMNWAEDLIHDDYRWGIDQCNRVLRKESRNSSPFYFVYFKDFPTLVATNEDVDTSDNENVLAHEFEDEHRSEYEKSNERKDARFRSQ